MSAQVSSLRIPAPRARGVPLPVSGRAGLLLGAVAASAAVYAPILGNYFFEDDFVHMQAIVNTPMPFYVFQPGAGHILIVRNLLFFLCYQAFGARPVGFFATMLATHLANVGLLFAVVRTLTGSALLACFGALLWGTARAQEGTLGWYSVYGNALAGTILLLVLARVARCWRESGPVPLREVLVWCLLLLVGCATFGVGIGLALVFPAAMLVLLAGRVGWRGWLVLLALPPLVLAGYRAEVHLYTRAYGGLAEFQSTLLLAMASEWHNLFGMLWALVVTGVGAIVHGVAAAPATAGPLPVALLGVFAAAALAAAVYGGGETRRLLGALIVLALGAYAIIAAGRATAYVSMGRGYGATTARYHYVATIPLCVVLCVTLDRLGARFAVTERTARALLLSWLTLSVAVYAAGGWHVDHHLFSRQVAESAVGKIRTAIDKAPAGAPAFLNNRPFDGVMVPAGFAGWAGVYTIYFPREDDPLVRFLENDPLVRSQALPGSRLAGILWPPT